jgi:hypothetical protein
MREQHVGVRNGRLGRLTAVAALVLLGTLAACSATPANAVRLWTPSYAFGTLGYRDFDVRTYCGERGARRMQVTGTPETLAVSVLTLGVYTPREVTIECR